MRGTAISPLANILVKLEQIAQSILVLSFLQSFEGLAFHLTLLGKDFLLQSFLKTFELQNQMSPDVSPCTWWALTSS